MAMACNLELAHRAFILKYSAPHLQEHDRNCLRRSGFKSVDLFSPSVLNSVEKSMRGIDLLKGKNWTVDLDIFQEEVRLFHKVLLKAMPEVLFVAKQTLKINKDHHNPPEGVMVAEGNDYPADLAPGGRLQSYYQVWEEKRMSSQGCAHSKTRLQNDLSSTNQIVSHSHNSQQLCKSTKTNFYFIKM